MVPRNHLPTIWPMINIIQVLQATGKKRINDFHGGTLRNDLLGEEADTARSKTPRKSTKTKDDTGIEERRMRAESSMAMKIDICNIQSFVR